MRKQIKLIGIIFILCLVFSILTISSVASDAAEEKYDWEYEMYGTGVKLTKYLGSASDISVPSSIKIGDTGYAVIRLDDGIFEDNDSINSVTLGSGILEIGNRAFYDCDNLVCVLIDEELTTIGDEAFYGCDNFNSFIMYKSVKSIGSNIFGGCPKVVVWCSVGTVGYDYVVSNGISYALLDTEIGTPETFEIDGLTYYIQQGLAYLIDADESLTDVTVPATVKDHLVVGIYGAFRGNNNLTKVTLPEGIKFIGEYAFYECYNLAEINFPQSLTTIGDYAFNYCYNLANVTFPESLTEIGERAFYYCNSLTEVVIPGSVKNIGYFAFENCYNVERLVIEEGVKYIGGYAFENLDKLVELVIPSSLTYDHAIFGYCDLLEKVTIESGVTSISGQMFRYCPNLTTVNLPETITQINYDAFAQCTSLKTILIPESVTYIDSSAFYVTTILVVYENSYAHQFAVDNDRLYSIYDGENMPEVYVENGLTYFIGNGEAYVIDADKSFVDVTIPATVKEVPVVGIYGAFRGNNNLTKVTLPEGIKFIGEYAFYDCYNLAEINFPQSLTTIGDYAFNYCYNLANVTFPESLTEIGERAFYYCNSLTEVVIPGSVKNIGYFAFENCYNVERLVIEEGVKYIGGYAFENLDKLVELVIPSSLTYDHAIFGYCDLLEKVTIESGVTSISGQMFRYCPNLTTVNLPETITQINYDAFAQCTSLKTILIPESVTYIDSSAFYVTTILVVYENSYAHQFAVDNNSLYFVVEFTENPDIAYGTSVSGSVKDTDGNAKSDVTVEIFYEDGRLKESVKTDANGNYSFTYAEVGKYIIKASDDNGSVYTTNIAVKRLNVFSVYIVGSTDLVLKSSYTVSGTVSEYPATVTVNNKNGQIIDTIVSEDGSFSFGGLTNGEYIFKAETENGSGSCEVVVFGKDVSDVYIEIKSNTMTVWGYALVENRDGSRTPRVWIDVKIYNKDGVVIATTKTDADGRYEFTKLPVGEYNIVATLSELRPDKYYGYDRMHDLTGYGSVSADEPGEYQVDIILREKENGRATISGKVTAKGETQDCTVILTDSFGNELAQMNTPKNGKYTFVNVPDGVYTITAITKSGGMGYTTVSVVDGKVIGETSFKVEKVDKIQAIENKFFADVPELQSKEEAEQYRDRISQEKNTYDGLSKNEKKQLSDRYVELLTKYVEWLAACNVTAPEGVVVDQGGLVVSSGEIANGDNVSFELGVEATDAWEQNPDGVKTEEDQLCIAVKDAAGDKDIVQYYEITMSKTKNGVTSSITDVYKDTDAMGKFRITLPIPEEYRGYNNYSIIHVHEGNIYTLIDLDDNPDTITIEVDKFSTFVLVGNTEEIVHYCDYTVTTTPAGCTTEGEAHYTCECGDSYTEAIAPTGHKWSEVAEDGSHTCEACGEVEQIEVEEPTESEKDHSDCREAANGFKRFWTAILNFFRRLFGKPTKCFCGDLLS